MKHVSMSDQSAFNMRRHLLWCYKMWRNTKLQLGNVLPYRLLTYVHGITLMIFIVISFILKARNKYHLFSYIDLLSRINSNIKVLGLAMPSCFCKRKTISSVCQAYYVHKMEWLYNPSHVWTWEGLGDHPPCKLVVNGLQWWQEFHNFIISRFTNI